MSLRMKWIGKIFQKDTEPNLFDYAASQKEENPKRRRLWFFLIPIVLPASFFAGYQVGKSGSCEEERATISAMTDTGSGNVSAPPYQSFLGTYRMDVSGHQGVLYIYSLPSGGPGATIHFQNWGKRVPEPLFAVQILNNRITFVRACQGARCQEIGATGPFRQDYQGVLSDDARTIEGTYTGGSRPARGNPSGFGSVAKTHQRMRHYYKGLRIMSHLRSFRRLYPSNLASKGPIGRGQPGAGLVQDLL